jgi:magnesium transporter
MGCEAKHIGVAPLTKAVHLVAQSDHDHFFPLPMIRCALFHHAELSLPSDTNQALLQWRESTDAQLWIDMQAEPDAVVREWLLESLGLHSLAVSDALRLRHPPKMEAFDGVDFLLFRGLSAQSTDIYHDTIQIALFVGPRLLVTVRRQPSPSTDRVWDQVAAGQLSLEVGARRVACRILRAIIDRYTPVLLDHEKRLEVMEDEMFQARDDALLEELVNSNTMLKKMRRTHAYHVSALTDWQDALRERGDVDAETAHALNDVFEHYERLQSMASLFQELTTDLMNGYLSLSAHRLNRIMQVLTVFTVVFLPLTLIAGIYGMNFEHMPELHWRYGYQAAITVMALIVALTLWLFKRRRWM